MAETIYEYATKSWPIALGCSPNMPCAPRCWAKRTVARLAQSSNPKIRAAHDGLTHDDIVGCDGGGGTLTELRWTGEVRLNEAHLTDPLHWRKSQRIAVAYHGDLFRLRFEDIDRVFAAMARARQHTFLCLTNQPHHMREYLFGFRCSPPDDGFVTRNGVHHSDSPVGAPIFNPERWPLPNVWLGVSACNQAEADERIPLLLQTPASVRWVSLEPLVGPVDLRGCGLPCAQELAAGPVPFGGDRFLGGPFLDWVTAGGESGPDARPMHPYWARSLRDQCAAAGVPFYFKQWGELKPLGPADDSSEEYDDEAILTANEGATVMVYPGGRVEDGRRSPTEPGTWFMERVGKRAAGRLLDGREHTEMPEAMTL